MLPLKVNPFWMAPVWEEMLPFDEAFNKSLLAELKLIGADLSTNPNPPDSLWDYQTPCFNILKRSISNTVTGAIQKDIPEAKELNIKMDSHMAWANVREPGEALEIHAHTDSTIAATYFVQTKENCGDLILYDGTHGINWTNGKIKPSLTQEVRIKAVESKLAFFPSYMMHRVEENKSDDLRITITCDLKKVIDKTSPNAIIIKSWAYKLNKICI